MNENNKSVVTDGKESNMTTELLKVAELVSQMEQNNIQDGVFDEQLACLKLTLNETSAYLLENQHVEVENSSASIIDQIVELEWLLSSLY